MPILVVNEPESPPMTTSLFGFCLILILRSNRAVNRRMTNPMPNFNFGISTRRNTIMPIGNPMKLPIMNRFNTPRSISALTLRYIANEMTSDRRRLIWMASLASNSSKRKGVATMEKPNPVPVCRMDASSIIMMNIRMSN